MEKNKKNKNTKSVGNGEGSLYYSDTLKCWVFQYYDTQGKRQTMKQKKKELVKDFKARVTKVKSELNTGTYICKSQITTKSIIKEHIDQKFNDGVTKENAYSRDKDTLKQIENCCSNFVNKPIQDVTLKDIQTAKEKIKEYSQSNINKIWQLLKKAFSIASSPSVRLIPFNIMNDENLKKPTSTKKTKKVYPLTQEEREKLEQILDNEERNHPYRNIVKIEWITSMRIGEVLARSKDDYNKDEKILHIHNTVTKEKNGKLILGKHTKTYDKKTGIDKGKRNFPVDKELEELLDTLTTEEINNIYGLLFWNYEKNTFINPRRINDWLESINKKYKISDKKLHNHRLRHDRITQWKEAEMDISAIQYLAGHVEDSKVTDVYIDVSQDFVFKQLKKSSRRNFAFLSQSSDLSHHISGVPFGTGRLANALVIYFTSVFFCCLINFINYYASFVTLEFRSTLQNFLLLGRLSAFYHNL